MSEQKKDHDLLKGVEYHLMSADERAKLIRELRDIQLTAVSMAERLSAIASMAHVLADTVMGLPPASGSTSSSEGTVMRGPVPARRSVVPTTKTSIPSERPAVQFLSAPAPKARRSVVVLPDQPGETLRDFILLISEDHLKNRTVTLSIDRYRRRLQMDNIGNDSLDEAHARALRVLQAIAERFDASPSASSGDEQHLRLRIQRLKAVYGVRTLSQLRALLERHNKFGPEDSVDLDQVDGLPAE